ncbi:hypothetical protein V6N11_008229 [Hibiscus sabdariffa]|uniref:Uncharacterized protein n=1 Tax=Hibiscus sabdariffa TaxID=183260 RepID=A0ABR2Q0J8_9ROSI
MGGFSKDKVTEFGAFQIVDAEVDLDHSLETAGDVHPRMLASDFAIIADTLSCNSFNGYSPRAVSVSSTYLLLPSNTRVSPRRRGLKESALKQNFWFDSRCLGFRHPPKPHDIFYRSTFVVSCRTKLERLWGERLATVKRRRYLGSENHHDRRECWGLKYEAACEGFGDVNSEGGSRWVLEDSNSEVIRQGMTSATARVEANEKKKTLVPMTLAASIVTITESISLSANSYVSNVLASPEGSSLQVKSHVSKTKVDAHIAVIISDFGMQDGLANKVKDLRGSGGLNRSFKENRRKGIQLRKNISHRSPPRTVLAEWIPNLTNEI